MRFSLTLGLLLLCMSCGEEKKGYIGNKLEDSSSLYNAYGIESKFFYTVDKTTQRILKIETSEMSLLQTIGLSHPEFSHTLLNNFDGSYLIDFSTKHLEVIASNNTRQKNPLSFAGTPVAAAYNPKKGILVLQDDLQSIGILIINNDGIITKSYLGGSLFEKGKSLVAGDVDGEGRLLLSMSDQSVVVVDLEKSIDAKSWQYQSFDSGLKRAYWIGPDNFVTNHSLVLSEDAVSVIDVATKTVVDKFLLDSNSFTVIGSSKFTKPHILTWDSVNKIHKLFFINSSGKLEQHSFSLDKITTYSSSYLGAEAQELTLMLNSKGDNKQIIKFRLSDNLAILNENLLSSGEGTLGSDFLIINKNSPLGYIAKHSITAEKTIKLLQGFNFDALRK